MTRPVADRMWRLRQRFGIAAPRVAIRSHIPWYWRWCGVAVLIAVSAAAAAWIYDAGRGLAGVGSQEGVEELTQLKRDLGAAHAELGKLRAVANAADSRVSIERTAQQKLA